MTTFLPYKLFPLNSPSKKVDNKDSYSSGFELIITQNFLRETHVKPAPYNSNNELLRAGATVGNLFLKLHFVLI